MTVKKCANGEGLEFNPIAVLNSPFGDKCGTTNESAGVREIRRHAVSKVPSR